MIRCRVRGRALTVLVLLGCGGRDSVSHDTGAAAAPSSAAATVHSPRATAPDPCPSTGRWALCSLEKRLKRAGFVLERLEGDSSRRPGFGVTPAAYKLGRGRIEVFLYESEQALAKDIAGLDTLAVSPPGVTVAWPSPPTLVRSGNLAAVFMDQTPRQAERLVLAITAGAPLGR